MATPQRKVAEDWEKTVGRRQPQCGSCEREFVVGDSYVSSLAFGEEGIERLETCPECFDGADHQPFAYWRNKVVKLEEKRRPLDINFLVDFFRRLQDQDDKDRYAQVAYIVTLLLVRKKILELVRTGMQGDVEQMIVRFRRDEDQTEYPVAVPELTAARMTAIGDDLTRIFNLDESQLPKEQPAEETEGGADAPVEDPLAETRDEEAAAEA